MSDPVRIALVGASGLVGGEIMRACLGREDVRLTAIGRRETPLPRGAKMEHFVAEPGNWGQVIEAVRPTAVISTLGTTWRKAGRDEAAFRSVDQDLVLAVARAAKDFGVQRFVSISSVGADSHARSFYLKVKGETDRDLAKVGFARLDVLRPGLLRGKRGGERRAGERIAVAASPLVNPLLVGRWRVYRAIDASTVAKAALYCALRPAPGRFVHDNEAITRAARSLPMPVTD